MIFILWFALTLVTVVLLVLYFWLDETTTLCKDLVEEIKKLKAEIDNRDWMAEEFSAAVEVCEICDEISGTGLITCEICDNAVCRKCIEECPVKGTDHYIFVCKDCLEDDEL